MPFEALTYTDLMQALGPEAHEGSPDGTVTLMLTRTTTWPSGLRECTVNRRITRPTGLQLDVLSPFRMGMKREGEVTWIWAGKDGWVQQSVGPLAAAMTTTLAGSSWQPPILRKDRGKHRVVVVFPMGASTVEWRVDWVRKIVTDKAERNAAGTVLWDETWTEVRQGGWRWLLRRVHMDRTGQGVNVDEQYGWDPDPRGLLVQR